LIDVVSITKALTKEPAKIDYKVTNYKSLWLSIRNTVQNYKNSEDEEVI